MTKETTEWYPGTVLPVRKGRYEVRNNPNLPFIRRYALSPAKYRYWDGSQWLIWEDAELSIMDWRIDRHQWRGLTKAEYKRRKNNGDHS